MRLRYHKLVGVCSLLTALIWPSDPCRSVEPATPPVDAATGRSPAEEIATFRFADDALQIELVAAEPDVLSPVALAWDADGRLFVAEMIDYPLGPMQGRISLLEDRDGDGRCERSVVFADKVSFPTAVHPWRDGVLVAAASDLIFLRDADGDGRADERRVLWTGFGTHNSQHYLNGFVWGLDNWFYAANGRDDSLVRRPDSPQTPAVSCRHRDFRFDPARGRLEALVGCSQFGQTRDDWGERFLSWNTIPVRHVVLDTGLFSENPYLDSSSAVAAIVPADDPGRVYPISPPPQRFNPEPHGYYNAMAGLHVYRGEALGDAYQGNAFVGETLMNLVHRRVLRPSGATFRAERAERNAEFLASTDPWFHPVFLATGPDGALYVCDLYRRYVEHPAWSPPHLRDKTDWRAGAAHGRIWRITRRDQRIVKPQQRISAFSSQQLVAALRSANGWQRDTAQRLLVERQDQAVAAAVRRLFREDPSSLARCHALWTLAGLDSLTPADLIQSLHDGDPRLRTQGLRACRSQMPLSAEINAQLVRLAGDADPRVRLELVATCRQADAQTKRTVLTRLAFDAEDPYLLIAIQGAMGVDPLPVLEALIEADSQWLLAPSQSRRELLKNAGLVLGATVDEQKEPLALATALRLAGRQVGPGTLAMLSGIESGLNRQRRSLSQRQATVGTSVDWPEVRSCAIQQTHDAAQPLAARVQALETLRILGDEQSQQALLAMLKGSPLEVQAAAARTLVSFPDEGALESLLKNWGQHSLAARHAALSALLRTPRAVDRLLESLEDGDVAPAELNASERQTLLRYPDEPLRRRAERMLADSSQGSRQEVIKAYQGALGLTGDRGRGAQIFAANCLGCHAMAGLGKQVGSDLAGLFVRPKETLLADILDPSARITPDYAAYTAITRDGQVRIGLLAAESPASITLKRAEGLLEVIARDEIEQLVAASKSLMPDEMEKKIDRQAMADLLEFLHHPDRDLLARSIPKE